MLFSRALATAVFFPIIIQSMAAYSGFDAKDRSTPCNPSQDGYDCVVNVFGIYLNTTSFVFCMIKF